jgi:tetratricopeptide (TPR) repeat protein
MAAKAGFVVLALCLIQAPGDNSPAAWDRLYRSAQERLDRGEFEAALGPARRGYDHWRTRADSRWYWPFRLQVAESLLELNRLGEARPLVRDSAPAPLEGRRLAALGFLEYRLRNFDAARGYFDAAQRIANAPQTAAKIELMRGMSYLKQENYSEAERSFRAALEITGTSASLAACYTLINLGLIDLTRFRYDEAMLWYERAEETASKLGLRRPEALAAGNLGIVYLRIGDTGQALKLLNEAASISEALHDPAYTEPWLAKLGEVYESMGDYRKAFEYYERARSMARPGIDDDWLSAILANLTELALETGDVETAERLNDDAVRLAAKVDGIGSMPAPQLNAARIAAARRDFGGAELRFKEAIATSSAAPDPIAEWQGHSGLAGLYRTAGRSAEAGEEYRNAIAVIEAERSKIGHDELKLTFLSHLIHFYQDYVDFLIDRGEPARAFEVAEACRARVLEEKAGRPEAGHRAGLARLEQMVTRSGTILFSYWLAPRRSFLWVIDSSGLHHFVLPPETEIAGRVRCWRDAITGGDDPMEAAEASGTWLFARLVEDHYRVPPGTHVVILPDGELYNLNFETLPAGGSYWIRRATIAVAPSLALLETDGVPARGRLLLIGNPDFSDQEFPRLATVAKEMTAVSEHFPARDVYAAAAATPAAYRKAKVLSYSTLHFAAHAVANHENPLDSAIILAGPATDHKLYARDVMNRPLNAGLVTLSACQTAGNKTYAGEGLTGLAWAFLSAGARNVVAGLWDVDDRAATETMARFYDALAAGQPPDSALRAAKLSLMGSSPVYKKPLYWAAFETFTRAVYPADRTVRAAL